MPLNLLRLTSRNAFKLRPQRPLPGVYRLLSASRPNRASEEPNFVNAFKNSPLFAQLADKPEALQVLRNFASLLSKEGIDFSKQPSKGTLLRLLGNRELREAAANVVQELRKAGIDINSQNAFELLSGTSDGQGKPK